MGQSVRILYTLDVAEDEAEAPFAGENILFLYIYYTVNPIIHPDSIV